MMDNREMRMMSKLHLTEREAASFLDSWFDEERQERYVSFDMPALERTILAATTLKLNGIKARDMGQDEWLTLAAGLAFTCLRGGEPVLRMTGRHFRSYEPLKIFQLGHSWRYLSGRGLKYWYFGHDLASQSFRVTTYYHINKRGHHLGFFDA